MLHKLQPSLRSKLCKCCFLPCYAVVTSGEIKNPNPRAGVFSPFAFPLQRSVEQQELFVTTTFAEGLTPLSHLDYALPYTFATVDS